jgi:hypothetical protein
MYNGSSLDYLQGLYFPLLRSKVTSTKFARANLPLLHAILKLI